MLDTYDYIIIALIFYLLFINKNKGGIENMENTEDQLENQIKKRINRIYKTDLEPIRKLGNISYRLYNDAGIKIPGSLELRGDLKINGEQLILGDKPLDIKNIIYHGDQVQLYNSVARGNMYNSGKKSLYTKDNNHSTTKFQIEKCGNQGTPPFNNGPSMCLNQLL